MPSFFVRWEKVVLPSIFILMALAVMPQAAAACHTVCSAVQPPDCLGCGFTAFRNVTCIRGACNFCEEDFCSVEAFSPSQRLACEKPAEKGSDARAVKVEMLSPRS
jgi:hypothetical protein